MRVIRKISQLIFLLLFIDLFLRASYPYETSIPADCFLRISPLAAIATIVSERLFLFKFIPALILLFGTLFLGRFFCGWICPLGTLIDGCDRIILKTRKRVKSVNSKKYRSWKFIVLILVIVSAVFSLQLVWVFDPIALLTRTMTTSIFPMFILLLKSILNILIRISWLEESVYSMYDWLTESILPVQLHYFQSSILILVLFGLIFLLSKVSPRFWCRNICPLGALLGVSSKFRILQRTVDDSCTNCGACQQGCKMNAIEDDFTEFSVIECIDCMNCITECPSKSVKYRFKWLGNHSTIDFSRRRFVMAGLGSLITVGAVKTGFRSRNAQGKAIRPPGALEETNFINRCIRCHECTRICSTTGGCLQPALLESGWEGLLTPIAMPRNGFCEYNCNLCGQVCPTGAIQALEVEDKQKLKMGTAFFDKNRCIPWYRMANCLVCEEHCPTPQKAIQFDEKEVVRSNGEKLLVKFPYVKEELCVGCGICVTKCPVPGTAGIFVTTAGETRLTIEMRAALSDDKI